jgi:hypothetical protein
VEVVIAIARARLACEALHSHFGTLNANFNDGNDASAIENATKDYHHIHDCPKDEQLPCGYSSVDPSLDDFASSSSGTTHFHGAQTKSSKVHTQNKGWVIA